MQDNNLDVFAQFEQKETKEGDYNQQIRRAVFELMRTKHGCLLLREINSGNITSKSLCEIMLNIHENI